MIIEKKNKIKLLLLLILVFLVIFIFFLNKFKKIENQSKISEPIIINLLTSVHPELLWSFKPLKQKILIKPGAVTTIEYIVENLGNEVTSGIATFAYFPNEFGRFISKLNCFCYDAKTLKPKEKDKYSVVLLIDQEATKDSKTKNIKEVTIQFTFFDYKDYKENKI